MEDLNTFNANTLAFTLEVLLENRDLKEKIKNLTEKLELQDIALRNLRNYVSKELIFHLDNTDDLLTELNSIERNICYK